MYPYPPPPHPGWPQSMYHYHRGPRRLFWFFLGGLAATIWLKGRERNGRLIEWPEERSCRTWWNPRNREGAAIENGRAERWREERERIAKIGSQATDTVADVSEAALESILTTVEMLKMKLAENRAHRQNTEEQPKRDPLTDSDPSHRV